MTLEYAIDNDMSHRQLNCFTVLHRFYACIGISWRRYSFFFFYPRSLVENIETLSTLKTNDSYISIFCYIFLLLKIVVFNTHRNQ